MLFYKGTTTVITTATVISVAKTRTRGNSNNDNDDCSNKTSATTAVATTFLKNVKGHLLFCENIIEFSH